MPAVDITILYIYREKLFWQKSVENKKELPIVTWTEIKL